MVAATSIAGVAMATAGAYAVCSPRAEASQHITAQNLSVVLSANGATRNGTPNITLGASGPTSSSFMTMPELITITNNGTMVATAVALQLTDHNNNSVLAGETWACLYGKDSVLFNEPLITVEGYGHAAIGHLTLAPGATDTYTVVYYAGSTEGTGCGKAFTGYLAGPYEGFSGQYSASGSYRTGTTNPAAASLTNGAEGGTLAPTVTVTYTGTAAQPDQLDQSDHSDQPSHSNHPE